MEIEVAVLSGRMIVSRIMPDSHARGEQSFSVAFVELGDNAC